MSADISTDTYVYPVLNYCFKVSIENNIVSFAKVSGLNMGVETQIVSEGGYNDLLHIMEASAKLPRSLRLEGGMYKSKNAILNRLRPGMRLEQGIVITVLGIDGEKEEVYTADGAFVTKWELSELNAENGQVLINTFEVAYTSLKRIS